MPYDLWQHRLNMFCIRDWVLNNVEYFENENRFIHQNVRHFHEISFEKKNNEHFISFMCQSTLFIHVKYLRALGLHIDNVFTVHMKRKIPWWKWMPVKKKGASVGVTGKKREKYDIWNPIRCKWPFEMFVKGLSTS